MTAMWREIVTDFLWIIGGALLFIGATVLLVALVA